jgi:hypothetical protein
VTRVLPNYLPGRALVELQPNDNSRRECYLVAQRFGDRVDGSDLQQVACDF